MTTWALDSTPKGLPEEGATTGRCGTRDGRRTVEVPRSAVFSKAALTDALGC